MVFGVLSQSLNFQVASILCDGSSLFSPIVLEMKKNENGS